MGPCRTSIKREAQERKLLLSAQKLKSLKNHAAQTSISSMQMSEACSQNTQIWVQLVANESQLTIMLECLSGMVCMKATENLCCLWLLCSTKAFVSFSNEICFLLMHPHFAITKIISAQHLRDAAVF